MVSVLRRIWLPSLGNALSGIGFGVIVTFGSLLFVTWGWTPVWLAFTASVGTPLSFWLLNETPRVSARSGR